MKKLILLLTAMVAGVTACQKENLNIQNQESEKPAEHVDPLVFNSFADVRCTLSAIRAGIESGTGTKSVFPMSDFVSYAETVMQEDGYDDRPNAILSEAFGSILNPDGEAFFGDCFVKVGNYGILYSTTDAMEDARLLATAEFDSLIFNSAANNCPFDLSQPENIYSIEGHDGVYMYNSFDIFNKQLDVADVETKASDVEYQIINRATSQLFAKDAALRGSFSEPSSSNQKVKFPSNSKIANDTKIYQANYGVGLEKGVKTKTMKKGFLGIWDKLSADLSAEIGGIVIREEAEKKDSNQDIEWTPGTTNYGWIEINTVQYDGHEYVIATERIEGTDEGDTYSDSKLQTKCDNALKWAKSKGFDYSHVDGIRVLASLNSGNHYYVRLKKKSNAIHDSKLTLFLSYNFKGTFTTGNNAGTIGDPYSTDTKNDSGEYVIYKLYMKGASTYDNATRGTQMNYLYDI